MTYLITYNLYFTDTMPLTGKVIKVKNKENEVFAKCALEKYLKQKYSNFYALTIERCEEDTSYNNLANDSFIKDFFGSIFK